MQNVMNLFDISGKEIFLYFALFLLVFFLILLLLREFWCWFFKTSEVVRLLEEISAKLTTNHNLQVDIQKNEYEWRKAEWEQKYGEKEETPDE